MNKRLLIISIILITCGLLMITASISRAQAANEFTVPLSDPGKRGKLKAHLNYGSITVKGTGRSDVLVKYSSAEEDEDDDGRNHNKHKENDSEDSREGVKRIGSGGMDLEVTENNNEVTVKSNSWSHKINLEIEIPTGMDLQLHTYNG